MAKLQTYARTQRQTVASVLTALAAVMVMGLGAWWTAVAAFEGEIASVVLRFVLSTVGALYYVALHQLAIGRRLVARNRSHSG